MTPSSSDDPSSYRQVLADLLGRLTAACLDVYGDRLVSLAVFGSVGRDRPRPDSDLDVLVVVDRPPGGRLDRVREFDRVEAKLGPDLEAAREAGVRTRLSPLIRSPEEMARTSLPFVDMVLDARVLVDRDGFFARFAGRLRDELRESGARRVLSKSPAHWRLGPASGKERDRP